MPSPSHTLLRLVTAGSVDDGKSTLIGRLLHDSRAVPSDQLADIVETSTRQGNGYVNLALLTDGLRAEREQGITIDVAYRYFATQRRRFIIADTPGHEQYTRNMVTGASTSNLAVVLVDARKGALEQSRRHACLAAMLAIPQLVVAVNKMDLVDWSEDVFAEIVKEFGSFLDRLDFKQVTFIPVAALSGDNVVSTSASMAWFDGPSLLGYLEEVYVASDENLLDARFPVQLVIRPMTSDHHDYRAYAGQIASGVFRRGDEVVILPSGQTARVSAIDTYDGPLEAASAPMSVALRLDADLDVSRGDMICQVDNKPVVSREVEAEVCWMHERPMVRGGRYLIKHTTRTTLAIVGDVQYRLDITNLAREAASELRLNELGRVRFRTSAPLMYDGYRGNRATGSFIVIDESSNDTLGAGMIVGEPA